MQQPIPLYAFTIKFSQRVRFLATKLGVSEPAADNAQPQKFDAIWDTGATNSVISQKVVDALDLKAVSTTRTQTANGEREASVYIVDLYLPNKVVLKGQPVIDGLLAGADVLVGMDVIGKGDFAVTHQGNGTCMTFQLPSNNHIDFVETINQTKPRRGFRQPKKGKHGKRNRG
jgi:predicted aspartyl protease